MKILPATAPFETIVIGAFGKQIKTTLGSPYLLIINDKFTKRTNSESLKIGSDFKVAKTFVSKSVLIYGLNRKLLGDDRKCFSAKRYQGVCSVLSIHN